MQKYVRAAALSCGVSMCALSLVVADMPEAWAQANTTYDFNIPAKRRLSALADFTAATGIQVVRPGAGAIGGTSQAVSGQYSAETALRAILAGSGLNYRFTGTRTVAIEAQGGDAGGGDGGVAPGEGIALDTIDVRGAGEGIGRGGVSEVNVTSADLERRNANDIRSVFRGEPRITVGSSLPMSQKVYVQGVEETNLAVSIDGSRQNNKVFHHNATTIIDPNLLKAVRVDAGVAPADAGPGALGGAIAYETKDVADLLAKDGLGGFLKTTYNFNGNTSTNNLAVYGRQNGFEALGSFNFAKGSEFTAGNGQEVLGTETDFVSGLGKFAYQSTDGHRFEISHEQLRDDAMRPFRANVERMVADESRWPVVRPYTLDRQNTVFTYTDVSPEGWWDPKFVLAYNRSKVAIDQYLVRTSTYDYTSEGITDSLNGKLENKFALSIGNIVTGVDFYRDRAKYIGNTPSTSEKADNIGAYAQARLTPFERTKLSFGVRGDHQDFEGVNGFSSSDQGLSGNVSGEYELTSFLIAKAGYSHVWAGVPLAENYVQNAAWDYGAGPKSVTSDNYTAGFVVPYEAFRFEAGVFQTEIDNARVPLWAANMALRAFDVQTRGFHIGGTYNWGDGFARVRFARTDAEIDGQPADTYLGQYLTAPLGDVLAFEVAHTFTQWNLTVGADVEIVFDYDELEDPATGIGKIEGYEVANAFVEYRPPSLSSLTLRGEVKNIFDATYAARGTYGLEYGTGVVRPLYETGRTFLVSTKIDF
ncbi:TonB-dependent receptor [Rhodomicrobium udaipurense]|uniref:TonB-dependent receptor n=2 Tax=Rhodomicrobium udaipurense TaxID=1202716 RepID=A0A8I1GC18_9HYPH|nr:TonB-dependent receptor [Rhodomicrobium udaipurense]MBJ7542129.1 TonB-dependent receptor [Rhodomicrobium udaipurense]